MTRNQEIMAAIGAGALVGWLLHMVAGGTPDCASKTKALRSVAPADGSLQQQATAAQPQQQATAQLQQQATAQLQQQATAAQPQQQATAAQPQQSSAFIDRNVYAQPSALPAISVNLAHAWAMTNEASKPPVVS